MIEIDKKLVFFVVFFLAFTLFSIQGYAWWDNSFSRKMPLDISTATSQTNYQIAINITYDSDMQADFDDIRFINASENQELNYWLENKTDSSWAYFWVKGNWSNANGTQAYIYYGNSTVSTTSNENTTFVLFDSFSSTSLDTNKWNVVNDTPITVNGSYLNYTATSGGKGLWLYGKISITYPIIMETRTLIESTGARSLYGAGTNKSSTVYDNILNGWIGSSWDGRNGRGWYMPYWSYISATEYDGTDIATNTWYKYIFKITNWANGDLSMNINGGTFYNVTNSVYAGATQTPLVEYYAYDGQVSYLDYVVIRKYAYPEPTYSIGSEETPMEPTSIQLWLNGNEDNVSFFYGTSLNSTALINITGLWVAIDINGTLSANDTTTSFNISTFPVGLWNITAYYSGNDSYLPSNQTYFVTIKSTNLTSCDILDGSDRTYYLTADIIDSSASPNCMNITVNNIVLDCQGYTIDGTDVSNTYGILINRSVDTDTNITVKNCTVTDWYYGIYVRNSNYNNLTNSTFNSNPYVSAYILSKYNMITNCTINNNDNVGINVFEINNTITNCTVNNNDYGIGLELANNITIYNNIVQNNSIDGIYIYFSTTNLIYNNLFNNTVNFNNYSTANLNDWNTTQQTGTRIYSAGTQIGGNYWTNSTGNGYSDTCIDANCDGFCDINYTLAENNIDYLPLSDEYYSESGCIIYPIVEPIIVCFKIKPICVKLSDFSIYLLKENKLIEWFG